MFVIRKLCEQDIKVCEKVLYILFSRLNSDVCDKRALFYWFAYTNRFGDVYGAFKNNTLVGMATALWILKPYHGLNGRYSVQIEDVAVLPERDGEVIGSALINEIEKDSRIFRAYKISLVCSDKNLQFYKKLGYFNSNNLMRKNV